MVEIKNHFNNNSKIWLKSVMHSRGADYPVNLVGIGLGAGKFFRDKIIFTL